MSTQLEWKWDDARRMYYYYITDERTFVFQNGERVTYNPQGGVAQVTPPTQSQRTAQDPRYVPTVSTQAHTARDSATSPVSPALSQPAYQHQPPGVRPSVSPNPPGYGQYSQQPQYAPDDPRRSGSRLSSAGQAPTTSTSAGYSQSQGHHSGSAYGQGPQYGYGQQGQSTGYTQSSSYGQPGAYSQQPSSYGTTYGQSATPSQSQYGSRTGGSQQYPSNYRAPASNTGAARADDDYDSGSDSHTPTARHYRKSSRRSTSRDRDPRRRR